MDYLKNYLILQNKKIASDTYEMILAGDTSVFKAPGQFLSIALKDCYLRRPFSVSQYNEDDLTIVYKVVGRGTRIMSELVPQQELSCLVGLGNGFKTVVDEDSVVLIGGSVGCAPLVQLNRELSLQNIKCKVVLGFNKDEEVFYRDAFLNSEVIVCALDGSQDYTGNVIEALSAAGLMTTYYYACGPLGMLRAVHLSSKASGQLSLEARMGCAYGVCRGCGITTKEGRKRVCKDGPVFNSEVLIWND